MCSSNLSTVSNNTDRHYWIVQIRDMTWACARHIWHAIIFLMLHIIWCGNFSKYYYCIYIHGKALLCNGSICHSSLGVILKYNDLLISVAKLIIFLKSRALFERRQLLGKQLPVLGRFLSCGYSRIHSSNIVDREQIAATIRSEQSVIRQYILDTQPRFYEYDHSSS